MPQPIGPVAAVLTTRCVRATTGTLVTNISALPPKARQLAELPWVKLLIQSDPTLMDPSVRFKPDQAAANRLNHMFALMR